MTVPPTHSSWGLRPSTICGAWALVLPTFSLSYSLQGSLLAHEAWSGFALFGRISNHLAVLLVACVVAFAAIRAWGRRDAMAPSWSARVAVVGAVLLVANVGLLGSSHPPSSAYRVGLANATFCTLSAHGVTPVPAPLGVDETFLVRPSYLESTYFLGERTLEASFHDAYVFVRLDEERFATQLELESGLPLVLHRVGPHWLAPTEHGARVISGPRRGHDLSAVHAFPNRVGAHHLTGWLLLLSAPLATLLLAWSERERRRSALLQRSAFGAPIDPGENGLTTVIRRADGRIVNLDTHVPISAHAVFVDGSEVNDAYREEARATGRVVHVSGVNRDETLARARTRIARLDALCVLVVLLLTAPALGAHLRGLTVSLPVGYNAAP